MTKAQALQRVWRHLHANLSFTIRNGGIGLDESSGPDNKLVSKKDRTRMDEAAEEVLRELAERASRL